MKDLASARTLARALVRVGSGAGKRVVGLLTDMSAPLGLTIGNALETREAIEVLQGGGPADTREITLALGAEMLVLGKGRPGRRRLREGSSRKRSTTARGSRSWRRWSGRTAATRRSCTIRSGCRARASGSR